MENVNFKMYYEMTVIKSELLQEYADRPVRQTLSPGIGSQS